MAVNTIGSNDRPIDVDELGIGVTPVWGARSLSPLVDMDYTFSTGLTDINNVITVDPTTIDHNLLLNYVANEHIDWTDTTENLSTSGSISVDTISENTEDTGVTIDGLLIKDGEIDGYVFDSDITVILASGKSLGKYENGDTIASTGLTPREVLIDIATEYLAPTFSSFEVDGQSTTVEVGTTLSGDELFTWSITENSGTVDTLSIYDITNGADLVTDTDNDDLQLVTITENQLNTDGETQQWRGVANDTGTTPTSTVNSSTFTVRSRYYRFYGPTASTPTDSASVRTLTYSAFQTGANTFTLETGTTQTKFAVALPPGVNIVSVIDTDALDANITTEYVDQGPVSVTDAGGTSRSYNLYEMEIATPYSESHGHQITTD